MGGNFKLDKPKTFNSVYTLNPNYADFVQLNLFNKNNPYTFLVDSQADISLVKISCLNPNIILNENEKISITGITTFSIQTLRTIHTQLTISNFSIPQIFHVVNDDFNIPSNGILGKDFLKNNKYKIDYGSMTISVFIRNNRFNIPIFQGANGYSCIIPPRCEVYRIFNLHNVTEPMFIDSQEVSKGVLIGKDIIDSKTPLLRVVNTTDEIKCIKIIILKRKS